MNSITIIERIAMHNAAINNLNTITQMTEIEKEFTGDAKKEAARIKDRAIHSYANIMRLLCELHVEHALAENENHVVQLSNVLS